MSIRKLPIQLYKEIEDFGLWLVKRNLVALWTHPILLDQIKEAQTIDESLAEIIYEVRKGKRDDYNIAPYRTL